MPDLPRILIVDDSRMVRATIMKHIRANFEVREEQDGEAGWETLLIDPAIKVVISDLSMPRLDGYGLLERVRTSKIARIREMPVIMISGDEDEASRSRAKHLGATDFITKGIGTAELLSRLETLVKLSEASQALEESRANAAVDPVTGLLSRNMLLRNCDQQFSYAQRHLVDMSVLVVGIDNYADRVLKRGTELAEQFLAKFAKLLQASVRTEDALATFAADQFAIVSPGTPVKASSLFALRLCEAVAAATISYQSQPLRLTVSIGIAKQCHRHGPRRQSIGCACSETHGAGDDVRRQSHPRRGRPARKPGPRCR